MQRKKRRLRSPIQQTKRTDMQSYSLQRPLCFFSLATRSAYGRLCVVRSFGAVYNVRGWPAGQLLATDSSKIRKQRNAINRHTTTFLPVLNSLVGDTHLPSHISDGVKLGNSVFEGLVHFLCAFDESEFILAQATLVAQVSFQLPQANLVGIFQL